MDEPITYKYAYDHGFEAGVKAERERIEAALQLLMVDERVGVDLDEVHNMAVGAALAVVTKEEA